MDPLKRKLAEAGWEDLDEVIDLTKDGTPGGSVEKTTSAGVRAKAVAAGWGDLDTVVDLTDPSSSLDTGSRNPTRKLKRSRRQVALSERSSTSTKCYTGNIQVAPFAQVFLEWRLERELADSSKVSGEKQESVKDSSPSLKAVPVKFKSTQEYSQTFLPLILEECKAQVLNDFSPDRLKLKVGCRVHVKDVESKGGDSSRILDVFNVDAGKRSRKGVVRASIYLILHSGRKSTPSSVQAEKSRFMPNKSRYLEDLKQKTRGRSSAQVSPLEFGLSSRASKGEVLLLAGHKAQLEFNSRTGQLVRLAQYALALVDKSGPPMFVVCDRRVDPTGCSYEIHCQADALLLKSAFCCQEKLWNGYCCTIANVTTSWREYNAAAAYLNSGNKSGIKHTILSGEKVTTSSPGKKHPSGKHIVSKEYEARLAEQFNQSQQTAIKSIALTSSSVSLVQGPPGTGKTSTLLGVLNTLHLLQYEAYYHAQLDKVCAPVSAEKGESVDMQYPILLVCAPSNTAVDGIANRIIQNGFRDKKLSRYYPKIVRCGVNCSDPIVEQVQLEAMVQAALSTPKHGEEVIAQAKRIKAKFESAKKQLRNLKVGSSTYVKCARDVIRLSDQFAAAKRKEQLFFYASSKSLSTSQKQFKIRCCLLEGVHIVLTTLSSSAARELECLQGRIKRVIVDEAGQAVEPSVLIPLQRATEQLVLIGDPAQLPPTVLSDAAVKHNYAQSLFERLQLAGHPAHLLDTQYRCHPSISTFVSKQFYNGQLKNGKNVLEANYRIPCHARPSLGPLVFYSIQGRESRSTTTMSCFNESEARFVARIYNEIRSSTGCAEIGIGIITPYSAQLDLLRHTLRGEMRRDSRLELNTVDGYQGREFDVIILSLVRSANSSESVASQTSLGFLRSDRRLNVALSRARYSLLVVGDKRLLAKSKLWNNFLLHVEAEGRSFEVGSGLAADFRFG